MQTNQLDVIQPEIASILIVSFKFIDELCKWCDLHIDFTDWFSVGFPIIFYAMWRSPHFSILQYCVCFSVTYGGSYDDIVVESSLNVRKKPLPIRQARQIVFLEPLQLVRVKRQFNRQGNFGGWVAQYGQLLLKNPFIIKLIWSFINPNWWWWQIVTIYGYILKIYLQLVFKSQAYN